MYALDSNDKILVPGTEVWYQGQIWQVVKAQGLYICDVTSVCGELTLHTSGVQRAVDQKPLTWEQYAQLASVFSLYPLEHLETALLIGVYDESGEIAGKYKKYLRGDGALDMHALASECGDVLWYLSQYWLHFMPHNVVSYPIGYRHDIEMPDMLFDLVQACAEFIYEQDRPGLDAIRANLYAIGSWCSYEPHQLYERSLVKLTQRYWSNVLRGNGDNRG